jgi:hypothetical protein
MMTGSIDRRLAKIEQHRTKAGLVPLWMDYDQTAEQVIAERFGPGGVPDGVTAMVLCWADHPSSELIGPDDSTWPPPFC